MDTEQVQTEITHTKAPKSVFFAALIVIFFTSLSAADSIGFVPCTIDGTCASAVAGADGDAAAASQQVALADLPTLGEIQATTTLAVKGVLPARILIPSVGIDLPIQNPSTRNVDALDALLQNGPARYASSAQLGENGNVLIFAHSSHLPIVHNQMFRAFNSLPELSKGDSITLVGADGVKYLYSVDSVEKASTSDGTEIPLVGEGKKLTLVTCDTLTGKSARFILTASFVGTI